MAFVAERYRGALVDHRRRSAVYHSGLMPDIVEIAAFTTTFDAEVAIAHLASVGIEAFLASDDAGGAFPSMTGLGGGARVLVRSEDAGAARDALTDLDNADSEEAESAD
jgi:hypothetical protein